MKEKQKSLEVKINEIKNVVLSARDYSPKRLAIVYNNSECRLKDIPGIDNKYILSLEDITRDCRQILDTGNYQNSFETYNSKIEILLNEILEDNNSQKAKIEAESVFSKQEVLVGSLEG